MTTCDNEQIKCLGFGLYQPILEERKQSFLGKHPIPDVGQEMYVTSVTIVSYQKARKRRKATWDPGAHLEALARPRMGHYQRATATD